MLNKNDPNYVYYLVGQNIKRCRKAKGWTQEMLSEKCFYSLSFIKNLESKKVFQTAGLDSIYYIALTLGVHPTELLKDLEND